MGLDEVFVAGAEVDGASGEFGAFGWVGLRIAARFVEFEIGIQVIVICDDAGAGCWDGFGGFEF